MIVAKIFAINKAAGQRDAHASASQATTQLSDFDRHTIYYSRKTLMIRLGTAQPLQFFFIVYTSVGWEMDQKISYQTQYVPSLAEGRRGLRKKNSVFFKDITKSQVNLNSQFLRKKTKLLQFVFVSQIGWWILHKKLSYRMKLILPIWLCFSKVLLSPG